MGTNYYLFTNNKMLARKCFAEERVYGYVEVEYDIVDESELGYKIHLNKCSYGWRPLFQCHKAFRSLSELERFFKRHENDLRLFDEYQREYLWDEYKQLIIDHAKQKPEPVRWVYGEEKLFNDGRKRLYTEKCSPEEAELWIPFNHLEYARTQKEAARKFHCYDGYLCNDEEFYSHGDEEYPVDWALGEFS